MAGVDSALDRYAKAKAALMDAIADLIAGDPIFVAPEASSDDATGGGHGPLCA